mmetsp:Transcript_67716/g.133660  ORF Transcript_67716/g.133660 Transcript_67716/m.133660 type:complete len:886 (+) Transcript_67716:71-2728(+)
MRVRSRGSSATAGNDVAADDHAGDELKTKAGRSLLRRCCRRMFLLLALGGIATIFQFLRQYHAPDDGAQQQQQQQQQRQQQQKVNEGEDATKAVLKSVDEVLSDSLRLCMMRPQDDAAVPSSDQSEVLLQRLKCVFDQIYPPREQEHWMQPQGPGDGTASRIYGEIPPKSVNFLAQELKLDVPGSVFYDLGSGFGRMVLQIYLTTQASRAVGVEIVEDRYAIAHEALDTLQRGGLTSVLHEAPNGVRNASMLKMNFTELDLKDATAIYMASLFFPKDIMWYLAHKLAALRDGTRILTLVQFPFDMYGTRRLPADSPLQALRQRRRFDEVGMTWGDQNSVFLYEVDRAEAFKPPFNAEAASNDELLAEAFQSVAKVEERFRPEPVHLTDTMLEAVKSLGLQVADEVCELGGAGAGLALRLALDSEVSRVIGILPPGNESRFASAVHRSLTDLDPSRIPWHRRVTFKPWHGELHDFISATSGPETFQELCGSATVVLLHQITVTDDAMLDMLTLVPARVVPGTIVIVRGLGSKTPCAFGLLPLLEKPVELLLDEELGFTTFLHVFVTAPSIMSLQLPMLKSLRDALRNVTINLTKITEASREELEARPSSSGIVKGVRATRSKHIMSGLVGQANGTLRTLGPPDPSPGRILPVSLLAKLHLASLVGGAESPYACLEENLYAFAPYSPAITRKEKDAGLFPEHAATYGEVAPNGLEMLLQRVGGVPKGMAFFDLGSGLGKAALQAFTSTTALQVMGIELSTTRHQGAVQALASLARRFPVLAEELRKGGRRLEFQHGDILQADLRNAGVVWMGSLAFPQDLMAKVGMRILEQAPLGCKVLTMLEFPAQSRVSGTRQLHLIEVLPMPVRWTSKLNANRAAIYEIIEKKA